MKVLVGCEESGVVREAFRRLGHDAMSCDLQPTEQPGPHYAGDVFDVIDYPWDLAILHFPCTHTSVSGAKHFEAKKMDGRQQAAVAMFMRGWRACGHIAKVAFEHPVSIMSSLFRQPDQIIQPWQFGHKEMKATCLWLRGLAPLEYTNVVGPPPEDKAERKAWEKCHREGPGPDRAKNRSRTYEGIAQAMAEQWGGA